MGNRIAGIKGLFTRPSLLALVGYCLYKTVSFHSYTTDFGLLSGAYGYISTTMFMAGVSVGLIGTAVAVLALSLKGRLAPLSLPFKAPLAGLVLCYAVAFAVDDASDGMLFALGLAWGVLTTVLTVCWMELFAYENSPMVLILQFAAALFVSGVVASFARALPVGVGTGCCLVMVVVCYATMGRCRTLRLRERDRDRERQRVEAREDAPSFATTFKKASSPILAWGFFELIVGLVNMYAYRGSSTSFSIAASAPIESMLICAVLIVGFVFVTNKAPNPSFIFLFVFPLIIGVFMLLPFFGEQFGEPMSVVIYMAYVATSTLANFWYIRVVRTAREYAYPLAALAHGGVRVMLVAGLSLGSCFSGLREGDSFVHPSIVAVVCVYCLVLVVVLWGYANSKGKQRTIVITERFEDARSRRIDDLVARYDLTPREKDVLAGLAQGHTARGIAEQLCISTSTVQGHVKSLYAKLGVNKKQQVLDLFECDPAER